MSIKNPLAWLIFLAAIIAVVWVTSIAPPQMPWEWFTRVVMAIMLVVVGSVLVGWLIFGLAAKRTLSPEVRETFAENRIVQINGEMSPPERTIIYLGNNRRIALFKSEGYFTHLSLFQGDEELFQLLLRPLEDGRRYNVTMTNGQIVGLAWGPNLDRWLGYVLLDVPLTAEEEDSGWNMDVVNLLIRAIKTL